MSSRILIPSHQTAELRPLLSERWALSPKHLLIVGWFGAFFLYHSYLPLFHSDIWGHVAYGHWILDHRALPQEDPFVPLTQGVPATDTAWLSQVVFAWVEDVGGPEWISHLFAMTVLLTSAILARVFYLQTRRAGLAVLGSVLVWVIAWSRHAVVRPEIFGSLALAVLLWLIVRSDTSRRRRSAWEKHSCLSGTTETPVAPGRMRAFDFRSSWGLWLGIPLVFAAWANLHGSYVIGLVVLGCWTLGRAVEVLREHRSLPAVFNDSHVRRNLLLTELGAAATFLNPYGIDLLVHTLTFAGNPNLDDVLEWFRLEIVSVIGVQVGISWVLMLVLFRHSRRRITPVEVLLLMVFIPAVCLRIRMVTWYAPIVTTVLMPHLVDVLGRWTGQSRGHQNGPQVHRAETGHSRGVSASDGSGSSTLSAGSFRYTVLAGLMVWMTFAFSPISTPILGGKPRKADHLYSQGTPVELTAYLRENPPRGQIANPQWWGDWLVWDGPPGLQVLMTTNAVHLAPHLFWRDYLAMARGQAGLEERLERYRIDTIVADKTQQPRLTRTVRRLDGWSVVYEDELALVAQRQIEERESKQDDRDSPSLIFFSRSSTRNPQESQ